MALNQPVGQVRMTNIAVVRYKVANKRFEIACYRNKVLDWRNKLEKDINEVLQSDSVYTNVSRGTLANRKELEAAFGTGDPAKVIQIILEKGQLQVSKKEREQEAANKFNEIATIIADKCINAETRRPFAVELIEHSMRELHVNVLPKKGAKQQALEVIQLLQKHLPISRARMRVRVECPVRQAKELKTWLAQVHGPKNNNQGRGGGDGENKSGKSAGGGGGKADKDGPGGSGNVKGKKAGKGGGTKKQGSKAQQQQQQHNDGDEVADMMRQQLQLDDQNNQNNQNKNKKNNKNKADDQDQAGEDADNGMNEEDAAPSWVLEREDMAAAVAAELVLLIDPGLFRALDEKVQQLTKGLSAVEVLDLKGDVAEDDVLEGEDQFGWDY